MNIKAMKPTRQQSADEFFEKYKHWFGTMNFNGSDYIVVNKGDLIQFMDEYAQSVQSDGYRLIRINDNGNTTEPVQYVGVYVLNWKKEWGIPEVAFVENDNQ